MESPGVWLKRPNPCKGASWIHMHRPADLEKPGEIESSSPIELGRFMWRLSHLRKLHRSEWIELSPSSE
jgi:hypothetical protein